MEHQKVNRGDGFRNKMEGIPIDDFYKQLQSNKNKSKVLVYNSEGLFTMLPSELYDSIKPECVVGVYDEKISKKELYNDIKFVLNE